MFWLVWIIWCQFYDMLQQYTEPPFVKIERLNLYISVVVNFLNKGRLSFNGMDLDECGRSPITLIHELSNIDADVFSFHTTDYHTQVYYANICRCKWVYNMGIESANLRFQYGFCYVLFSQVVDVMWIFINVSLQRLAHTICVLCTWFVMLHFYKPVLELLHEERRLCSDIRRNLKVRMSRFIIIIIIKKMLTRPFDKLRHVSTFKFRWSRFVENEMHVSFVSEEPYTFQTLINLLQDCSMPVTCNTGYVKLTKCWQLETSHITCALYMIFT